MSHEASGLKEDQKKVLKGAIFMATGTLTSRILGLLRDIALAALFDRRLTDAWTAAFRLPNFFRRLFGEGAFSASFIPVFIEEQKADHKGDSARNLINSLYTLFLIFFGTLTLLGILNIETVLSWILTSTYRLDPEKWLLTIRMGRIMFGFIYFVCSYAYLTAILNALGSFGWGGLAPALLNISMLVFTFLPEQFFAQAGDGLAWGVLVGGVLQSLLVGYALRARGQFPKIQLRRIWTGPVLRVLKNMLPSLLSLGLLQFSTLVNLHFASGLGEGAISCIYWADRFLELPLSLISVSLGTAVLPTLSEFAVLKMREKFSETLENHIVLNLFFAIPAALGLYYLAQAIVENLFLRGQFTQDDVARTSLVLQIYALSLFFVSSVRVLTSAFFALKNIFLPAFASVLGLAIHISGASYFSGNWGLRGLVFSGLLGLIVQFCLMILFTGKLVGNIKWKRILFETSRISLASMCMLFVLKAHGDSANLFDSGRLFKFIFLVLAIIVAVIVYFATAAFLGSSQARNFLMILRTKLKLDLKNPVN